MMGQTLRDIRAKIESLATADGDYCVVCGRTGERPVPSDGLEFGDRQSATEAARLTEQYRAALRRYDPRLPCYDPIVCETPVRTGIHSQYLLDVNSDHLPDETITESSVIEFCHQTAAAVFETLTEEGYSSAEVGVMDAYLRRAETVADRDRLCLVLLESIAIELDRQLTPAQQSDLLSAAAERLPAYSTHSDDDLLSGALSYLETASLLDTYTTHPRSIDLDADERQCSRSFSVRAYAFEAVSEQFPTLPLALALLRCDPTQSFAITSATPQDPETWCVEVAYGPEIDPRGLSSVSVTAP
jgi:hypothetical protein